MNKKICILIPAYNEESNIQHVVRELRKVNNQFHIVVINDGSTDNTARLAKKEKIVVLANLKNCGSGAALKKGMKYALTNNYEFTIQIDGDGQHDPKYISKLVKTLKTSKTDLVIGSRYIKKTAYKTPFQRYVCIRILSILYLILYGFRITDPTSGYRGFNKRILKFFINCYTERYPETISIAPFLIHKYKIKEVSVVMRPRLNGKSSINVLNGFYYFLEGIIQIIIYRFSTKKVNKN